MPYLSIDRREGVTRGTVQATFTRPSDTTQYAAADVVGPVTTPANMTFSSVVRGAGWGGTIRSASLHKTDNDLTAATFDLYLFDSAPAAIADNSEWVPTDDEMLACIGFVAFAAASGKVLGAGSATGNFWHSNALCIPFACASSALALYGVLVARDTYTPASAEKFAITLGIERD